VDGSRSHRGYGEWRQRRLHDHEVGVGRRHRFERAQLVGRQIHVRTVEALRLVGPGQTDHHHHGVGRTGDPFGLAEQGRIVGGLADAVPGGEGHLPVDRAQLFEQHIDAGRIHLRRPGTLESGRPGEFPYDREPRVGCQRQHAVVGQQHDGLGGCFARQGVVDVRVERLVQIQHRHALGHELQNLAYPGVEHVDRHLAGLDRGNDRLWASAEGRGHLQVEPGQ
jgi:hypothetical protein